MAKIVIMNWNSQKGFGFVKIAEKSVFVHYSAIEPRPIKGSNLHGLELCEVVTEKTQKGLRIKSALALEEFERRKQRAEDKASEARKRELDEIFLRDNLERLTEEVEKHLPLKYERFQEAIKLLEGVTASIVSIETKVTAVDPNEGPTTSYSQKVLLMKGTARIEIKLAFVRKGWETNRVEIFKKDLYKGSEVPSELVVEFTLPGGSFEASYPATISVPELILSGVVQYIRATTPIGVAEEKYLIRDGKEVFGDYDIKDLRRQEVQQQMLVKLKMERPKIDFCVVNTREESPRGAKWVYSAGVKITIHSAFMSEKGSHSFYVYGELNRETTQQRIEEEVLTALKRNNLRDAVDFSKVMVEHIMRQVPHFSKFTDPLVIVGKSGQELGIAFVVAAKPAVIRSSFLPEIPKGVGEFVAVHVVDKQPPDIIRSKFHEPYFAPKAIRLEGATLILSMSYGAMDIR